MSTIGNTRPTLVDIAKSLDPNGKVATVAELLAQTNEMLADMAWVEANLPTGHQMTVRTGLPSPAWRLFNQGVQPTKSTKAQIVVGIGMLEDWAEVDKALADLNGNAAAYRLSEGRAHLEGMNQEMQSTLFYGNSSVAPEEMNGLSVIYSDPSAANGRNVIDAGGAGSDNSSIWFITWSAETIFGIYPKGSKAGLSHEDKGIVTVENAGGVTGALMDAYRDKWEWKAGVAVKDWRHAVRIGSIDISNLVDESGAADLTKLMIKASHRLERPKMGRTAVYMNRSLIQYLDTQRHAAVQAGGGLTYQNVDGEMIPFFRGFPVRCVDALTEAETAV